MSTTEGLPYPPSLPAVRAIIRTALKLVLMLVFACSVADRAVGAVLFEDDFNRPNSLNSLGTATSGGGAPLLWFLQRDPDNSGGPYDTNPSIGPDVEIVDNMLRINCAGRLPGAPQNNNDMATFYVDYDLNEVSEYSVIFDYTHLHAHQFDLAQPGSQTSGGFFILPRAQGDDHPGNQGYVIRRINNNTNSPLAVYFYSGTERSGSPANIPLASLGTALGNTTNLLVDQVLSIQVDVYGPAGEFIKLTINGEVIDEDRQISDFYNNGVPDHVIIGYNALGTGQRRLVALIDNLVVSGSAEPPGDPSTVTWTGDVSEDWDGFTLNWRTNGTPVVYANNDFARFDDSGSKSNVNIVATLFPGSLTVSNDTLNYTLGGPGRLRGTMGLTKQGSGTAIIANEGLNDYIGGTLIAGGTLQIGNGGTGANLPSGVTNNATLAFNSGDDVVVSLSISGSGSVVKNGGNTLTFAGNDTYTGATIVNAGALLLNGSLSGGGVVSNAAGSTVGGSGSSTGPVNVSGALSPGAGGAGTFTINNDLTLHAGGTLALDLNTSTTVGGGVNDLAQVNGALNLNNNTIELRLLGAPQLGSPYRLVNYTGAKTGNFSGATVVNGRYTAVLDQGTANQINATLSGVGPSSLRWSSTGDSTWANNAGPNWFNITAAMASDVFFDGDTVLFDDTAAHTTVALTGPLAPASVTVNNPTKTYTLAGTGRLTGAMSFTKSGSAPLILNSDGSNDFTGGFIINSGVVHVGQGGDGGGLGNGPVVNNGILLINKANTLTISGELSGSGPLTNNGAGTTILSASNSFTGGITVNAGTVRLEAARAAGTASTILVNDGATLVVGGANTNSITLAGGTLGVANSDFVMSPVSELTIANGTINTIISSDPQNPTTSRNIQVDGTLRGGGTILVKNADNVINPDGGQGVRFRGTTASDFTGTIIYTNNTKGEIQVADPGPFSPVNTGKFILHAGAYTGANGLNAPVEGGYMEFNIRNTTGDTVIPSDFEIAGTGAVVFNLLGSGGVATLGNLRVGGNQEIIGYRGSGALYTLGFASVTLTGGTVTLSPKSTSFGTVNQAGAHLALNDVSELSPSSLVMNGLNRLTLSGSINYSGTTVVSNGTLAVTGSKTGGSGMTLHTGTRLEGNGSITDNVTVGGTLVPGDGVSAPSSLTISGNLTLNSATNIFLLSAGSDQNTSVQGINTLNINGNNVIRLNVIGASPLAVNDTYTLFQFNGTLPSSITNNLQLEPVLGYTIVLVDPATTPNQLRVQVVQASKNLVWIGTAGPNWDVNATVNWNSSGGVTANSTFTNLDFVTFNNQVFDRTNVTLVGALEPLQANLFNELFDMFYDGSGHITGIAGMRVRVGSGIASYLRNTGSNDFTGPVVIEAGTINVSSGGLGSGQLVMTNFSAPPAELVLSPTGTLHINNTMSGGAGTIRKTASGTAILNGASSFSGSITVEEGTLTAGAPSALGATNATRILSGATLDVGSQNLGSEHVLVGGSGVGGQGAVVNNGPAAQTQALRFVTLTDNTTFGGAMRWDIRGPGALRTDLNQPFSITKVGPNQISLVGIADISSALKDIDIQEGLFAIQTTTTQVGDPAGIITVHTNATLGLWALTTPLNKVVNVNDGGTVMNENGTSAIVSTMNLEGHVTFGVPGAALVLNSNTITTTGTLSALSKTGPGSLRFVGNALPDATVLEVLAGTLDLTEATVTQVTRNGGQTLRGNGTILGNVTANSGATVAPGAAEGAVIGTLTVSNTVTLNGGSQTLMDLDADLGTSDRVTTTNITYGGTLTVSTVNGTLTGGQSFQLFQAGGYNGGFTMVTLPPLGAGLTWSNSLATDGRITVIGPPGGQVQVPHITSVIRSGANLIVSGTNGTMNGTFYVISSTNVAAPLASWTRRATNAFDASGNFSVTNAIDASKPQEYFNLLQQVP